MSQYQQLLLIIDPEQHDSAALQRAAALAQASGAALHISAFVEPFSNSPWLDQATQDQIRDSYLQEQRKRLDEQAATLRSQGIRATTEVVWTAAVLEEILQHVAEMQPDLLIKDVRHESAFKRAFFTPLDWHLLRECPVPVHLVGAAGQALPRKIMAAVDPSRPETSISGLNERIIQAANALALQCDAELHLVHTYDVSSVYLSDAGGGGLVLADLAEQLRHSLEKAFFALAEQYSVPAERRHFIRGTPTRALADYAARNGGDVIVLGTLHHTGLDKLVGSTTEHLLYRAPCSILVVKV